MHNVGFNLKNIYLPPMTSSNLSKFGFTNKPTLSRLSACDAMEQLALDIFIKLLPSNEAI